MVPRRNLARTKVPARLHRSVPSYQVQERPFVVQQKTTDDQSKDLQVQQHVQRDADLVENLGVQTQLIMRQNESSEPTENNGRETADLSSTAQTLEEKLSYGLFDWAITDQEAHDVIAELTNRSDTQLSQLLQMLGATKVNRLLDNLSESDRTTYARTVARVIRLRGVAGNVNYISGLLSYGLFDWAITDQESSQVVRILETLSPEQFQQVRDHLTDTQWQRLLENMPEHVRRAAYRMNPEMLPADQADPDRTYEDFSSSGTLFVNGISPSDVIQSNLNDCYLVALLSSLANTNPGFIRNMIQEDAPGSYRVRFYEKDESNVFNPVSIAVNAELPSENGVPLYGHSEDTQDTANQVCIQELWPSIIEKAYAKLKGNYADIDWGNTIYTYEAVFGTRGTRSNTSTEEDTQWEELKRVIDNGQPVVASTGRHVITVLSYNESGGNRNVTVRDQAGGPDEANRVETISFSTFRSRFTYFRYASVPETNKTGE